MRAAHPLLVGMGTTPRNSWVFIDSAAGFRGTGRRGQLIVRKIVLQGHGRHGLVLRLDFDAFLRLNRLVDAVVVAAARQNTTGASSTIRTSPAMTT